MAKSPASKKNVASTRTATQAARKTPPRPPAKSSHGRPAGLFTWLAIGLVVVVVVTLVLVKVSSSPPSAPGKSSFQQTDPQTVSQLTTIPMSVFNTVGVTSTLGVAPPIIVKKKQPSLTAKNAAGDTVPEVFYLGAEYCPYCAAQRWPTIIALSRFGTWSGLGNTSSIKTDIYPNTQTFTFQKATYTSKYIVFTGVEEYHNYLNAAGTNYALLQKPTTDEQTLVEKYDTPKYIPGLTKSDGNPIPFITFENKYLVSGASYSPDTLTGLSRTAIATGLSDPTSPITDAIIASANYQTATICSLTKDQPSNVCTSSGVLAAKRAMGIK